MALYLSLVAMFLLIGGTSAQCQLQLVGGFGPNSGFLQVFVGEWRYTTLPSEVTPDGANGLCQDLGFEGANNASMVPVDNVGNGTLDIAQCNSTQGLAAGMGCELGQSNGTQDLLYMDCIPTGVGGGPRITRVHSGLPLPFTLIIIIASVALVAVVVVASLLYMCIYLFCCKKKSSIWKRARSLRSRTASYSFVWRQAAAAPRGAGDNNGGAPAETHNTEYTQWKDEDVASIKSGSMRMHTDNGSTFTGTTFGGQVQGMDLQQNAA